MDQLITEYQKQRAMIKMGNTYCVRLPSHFALKSTETCPNSLRTYYWVCGTLNWGELGNKPNCQLGTVEKGNFCVKLETLLGCFADVFEHFWGGCLERVSVGTTVNTSDMLRQKHTLPPSNTNTLRRLPTVAGQKVVSQYISKLVLARSNHL